MSHFFINPTNIANNAWIWDHLEKQRQNGQYIWKPDTQFNYNGHTFHLKQTIFARKRDNPQRGYAYEMISNEYLGRGAYGSVNRISCTLSLGKTGIFQAKDKHRVVKTQDSYDAEQEYQVALYAKHLHVKNPTHDMMVMKEMNGRTLYNLLKTHGFSRKEGLELIKALLIKVKEQLIDKKLAHNDLHEGNILVDLDPQSQTNKFKINIIDFGLARYLPKMNLNKNSDDLYFVVRLIYKIWSNLDNLPEGILQLLKLRHMDFLSINNFIQIANSIVLAPTPEAQQPLDLMLAYLKELTHTHNDLKETLRTHLLESLKNSSATNLNPIKQAVLECKKTLAKYDIDLCSFPYVVFDDNAKKQHVFNKIFSYFKKLENKGKTLLNTPYKKEGEQLCLLVETLRQNTFNAAYMPEEQQKKALTECSECCKKLLQDNQNLLDIHMDSNYIFAEIGVIFASLIVLYPIVAGIHYLATRRFSFFSQTTEVTGAEQMAEDFSMLEKAY
ncbi:MAG: protein kinase family protein [Legionella longbeachae]|nr:protein kinase family protein [Legionella longbeachae]